MDREEIIQRFKNISEHAVHRVGEAPYILSLDDGSALCDAVKMLEREKSVIDKVLEIIDKMPNDNPSYWNRCDVVDREALREAVMALKGEE